MTSVEITFEDDPYEITVRVEHPLTEHALDKVEDLLHALAGVDDDQVEERMREIVREELTRSKASADASSAGVKVGEGFAKILGEALTKSRRTSGLVDPTRRRTPSRDWPRPAFAHAAGCPANLPVVAGVAHACTCHDVDEYPDVSGVPYPPKDAP